MASNLINYALYQIGWFCCVMGAANGRPWSGAAAGGALILVHLGLVSRPLAELKLLLAAGMIGLVADGLQSYAGFLEFRSGQPAAWLAPPWIAVLWMQLATLFRFGLSYMLGRYVLAAVLAAVALPLLLWLAARWTDTDTPGRYRWLSARTA